MMNNEKMTADKLKLRTKNFAVEIVKYYRNLPKTEEAKIIGKQLLRSATSVAANYRAVCRARSDAEFFAKLSIVVEEADETLLWLEIIIESELIKDDKTKQLYQEALEILSIMAASRKTIKLNK
jgi:four helix bundle protein